MKKQRQLEHNNLNQNRRSETIGSGITYEEKSINNRTEPTNPRRQ